MPVKLVDTRRQYEALREEIDLAIRRVLDAGRYVLGPEVAALESEIAAECGCEFGVALASGTDALLLSLAALNVGPGDEVITTPFTFVSTAEVISMRGAKPVFADIRPDTYNLDPASVEAVLTDRTVGIIPVDLYGQVADMEAIQAIAQRRNLWIIEDACQALGAHRSRKKAGSFGALGTISFFPTKNLGAFGDAGMVVSNDHALADRVRKLRYHGSSGGYEYDFIGYNSRLDELQAAILRAKLPFLGAFNETRRRTAELYRTRVHNEHIGLPVDETAGGHVWHQFTVRSPQRDQLSGMLREHGIESKVYYPVPLHLQKTYADLGYQPGSLPEAERAAAEVLSVPISHELTDDEREEVSRALAHFAPA